MRFRAHIAALLLMLPPFVAEAGQGDGKHYVSPHAHDVLSAAQELMAKDQHRQAIEKLRALLTEVEDEPYEAAVTWQMLGYAYSSAGDYKGAADAFRRALRFAALPAEVAHNLTYNLAQLLIHDEQYKEGLGYLETWFRTEPSPSRESKTLAAVGYYRSGNCEAAIPFVRAVIAETKPAEEQWYQVLLGCHAGLRQFDQAAQVLEQMLRLFPAKGEYWVQLAGIYQQLKQDDKAIALMELANRRGILGKNEIVTLARMYLAGQMPYKAVRLLESKLADGTLERNRDNLELLADGLLLAQERAKAAQVLDEVAGMAPEGENFFRLGRIYFDLERWPEALAALQSAIRTGGVKDPPLAHLLLGITAVHVNKDSIAQQSLSNALRDKSTHDQAQWWLRRLQERTGADTGTQG